MLNSYQILGYLNLTGTSAVRGVGKILRFKGHLVNGSPQKFSGTEPPVQAMIYTIFIYDLMLKRQNLYYNYL